MARLRTSRSLWTLAALAPALAALAALPATAEAQGRGDGFLFRRPIGLFGIRGGYNRASAGSDIYSFVQNELTLDRGSFDAPAGMVDLSFHLSRKVDLAVGLGYAARSARSEFRAYVDQNNLPIEQTTGLRQVPLTMTARYRLVPAGRAVGRLAWVPAHLSPWVGAGGGLTWYRFRQHGDFVDFISRNVFRDDFRSSGWAPGVHAAAGLDIALGPRFVLTTEWRYSYAKAPMDRDFVGFQDIDLSGLSFTTGLSVRLNREWAR